MQLQVPLKDLAPGTYVCQLNVVDTVGRKFAFPRSQLVIQRPTDSDNKISIVSYRCMIGTGWAAGRRFVTFKKEGCRLTNGSVNVT